jgi:flagellar biosynthesis regulator FlaF
MREIVTPSPAQIHRALQEQLDELRAAEAMGADVAAKIKAVQWLLDLWTPQELAERPDKVRWLN